MSKTFIAVVGEKQKEFTLYTDVACRSSKFFQAALSKGWKESLQNRVTLREITTIHFQACLQWLSTNDPSHLEAISRGRAVDLYILGDYLDDSAFRTAMLKTFVREAIDKFQYPRDTLVTQVWESTPEGSPLRKMVLEIWITESIEKLAERFAKSDRNYPKAFIVECLRRIGETNAAANKCFSDEERKQRLQSRRDEILKDIT